MRASMVVTNYRKRFRTGADRHNGVLMPLLLLVAETKIKVYYYIKYKDIILNCNSSLIPKSNKILFQNASVFLL